MTDQTDSPKRFKVTRGVWRFVCVACAAAATVDERCDIVDASKTIGRWGWRIAWCDRHSWGLRCQNCAPTE